MRFLQYYLVKVTFLLAIFNLRLVCARDEASHAVSREVALIILAIDLSRDAFILAILGREVGTTEKNI